MILLLSGGLDSVAAWRLLGLPDAVHFNLGTIPVARERKAIEWACAHFGGNCQTRSLPMGEYESANGYLPFRNAVLILAAAQMDHDVVIAQVAEWAPDKNLRFYRRLRRAVNMPGTLAKFDGRLTVHVPFAGLSKGELLASYYGQFGLAETQDLLQESWSCYRDETLHCGHCARVQPEESCECSIRRDHRGTPE